MLEREPQIQDLKPIQEITSGLNQEGIVVLEINDSLLGRVGKLFSEKIKPVGKRIALPTSVVILAIAAACSRGETGQSIPPEAIQTTIPDLVIQRFPYQPDEITDNLSDSFQEEFEDYQKGKRRVFPIAKCGESFVDTEKIKGGKYEDYYFKADEKRFYLLKPGSDKKLLDWSNIRAFSDLIGGTDLSCNGELLYSVRTEDDEPKFATILASFNERTKTIMKDSNFESFNSIISDDGSTLVLSFNDQRGLYVINLKDWSGKFHLDESPETILMNDEGSLLYVNRGVLAEDDSRRDLDKQRTGYIYNTITGEKTSVSWPYIRTPDEYHVASSNLNYIARTLAMFSADREVEGQWGIVVHTPVGQIIIESPDRSFQPSSIDNNGTIYTRRGEVFKFEDGTYKLIETIVGPVKTVDQDDSCLSIYQKLYSQTVELTPKQLFDLAILFPKDPFWVIFTYKNLDEKSPEYNSEIPFQ